MNGAETTFNRIRVVFNIIVFLSMFVSSIYVSISQTKPKEFPITLQSLSKSTSKARVSSFFTFLSDLCEIAATFC